MFKRIVLIGLPLLVFSLLFTTHEGSGLAAGLRSQVFAHYYQWWDGHKVETDPQTQLVYTQPLIPQQGWYNNQTNQSVVEGHIRQAAQYNIAGFAVEWKGKGSGEDTYLNSTFKPATTSTPSFKWMLTFDSDQWAQRHGYFYTPTHSIVMATGTLNYNFNPHNNTECDNPTSSAKRFVCEVQYICQQHVNSPVGGATYARFGGTRPMIFIFGYNRWIGDGIGNALRIARNNTRLNATSLCNPYFIGDFQISPAQWAVEYDNLWYMAKAGEVDAISNYTLFGGYPRSLNDSYSTEKYIAEGNLTQAFANGQSLAQNTGRPFYPGIVPQYFKGARPAVCASANPYCFSQSHETTGTEAGPRRLYWNTPGIGYIPLARGGASVTTRSQRAIDDLWAAVKTLTPAPTYVFVTSWNEPVEGTMIEPTSNTNGEWFTMGFYFLDKLKAYTLSQ